MNKQEIYDLLERVYAEVIDLRQNQKTLENRLENMEIRLEKTGRFEEYFSEYICLLKELSRGKEFKDAILNFKSGQLMIEQGQKTLESKQLDLIKRQINFESDVARLEKYQLSIMSDLKVITKTITQMQKELNCNHSQKISVLETVDNK